MLAEPGSYASCSDIVLKARTLGDAPAATLLRQMRKIPNIFKQMIDTPPSAPPMITPRAGELLCALVWAIWPVPDGEVTGEDAIRDVCLAPVVVLELGVGVTGKVLFVFVNVDVGVDVVAVDEVGVAETGGGVAKIVFTAADAPHAMYAND